VILADTSAWVEFLRHTGSPANVVVRRHLDHGLAVTEPIVMELLAGARDEEHLARLRALIGRADLVPCEPGDWAEAAALYRRCRRGGETPRRLVDCLIAAVAIRENLAILHHDSDFDVLARHTALRVHQP
jgi:predicted nucleic acid-binding protein